MTADLAYHGDQATGPGLVDFAVNVRTEPPPPWLTEAIAAACTRLAAYPDPEAATSAVARYHGRPSSEVLLTSGAAEAFTLLARATPAGAAVTVVHPQFTEPERALRVAGHRVHRLQLAASEGFRFDPTRVPFPGDLVVIGNPTNPTGVLHPAADLLALARPGRVLVVDEAFQDAVPGEPESLSSRRDVPGLVVVRSLTKTWGLAGLRIGYLLGPADVIAALRRQQVPWSVSTPALAAAAACATDRARAEAAARALDLDRRRELLRGELLARGLNPVPASRAPFLLVESPPGWRGTAAETLPVALARRGVAVRRGDTFPGLGPAWFRVAAREPVVTAVLLAALDDLRSV